jgi:hypothetical protein
VKTRAEKTGRNISKNTTIKSCTQYPASAKVAEEENK